MMVALPDHMLYYNEQDAEWVREEYEMPSYVVKKEGTMERQGDLFAALRDVLGAPGDARFIDQGFSERKVYREHGTVARLLRRLFWRLPLEWSDSRWFYATDTETFRVKEFMVPTYMTADGDFHKEDITLRLHRLLVEGEARTVNAGYGPMSNLVIWGVKS